MDKKRIEDILYELYARVAAIKCAVFCINNSGCKEAEKFDALCLVEYAAQAVEDEIQKYIDEL